MIKGDALPQELETVATFYKMLYDPNIQMNNLWE